MRRRPRLQTRLLLRERNGVLLPGDHPLAGQPEVRLRDLADTPFVLFPRAQSWFYDPRVGGLCQGGHVASDRGRSVAARQCSGAGSRRIGGDVYVPIGGEPAAAGGGVLLIGPAPESRLVVGWRAQPLDPARSRLFLAWPVRAFSDDSASSVSGRGGNGLRLYGRPATSPARFTSSSMTIAGSSS